MKMKMPYLPKNKIKNEFARPMIISVALLALVFAIDAIAPNIFQKITLNIGQPLWKAENAAFSALKNGFVPLNTKKNLARKISELESEITELKIKTANGEILQKENDELRAAAGLGEKKRGKVTAMIFGKPPILPYDTLLVNAGENKNVRAGDKVFAGGILIGKIAETTGSVSKVVLYGKTGEKILVLLGPKAIETETDGRGDGNFVVRLPREVVINEGDMVVLAEAGGETLGVIKKISKEDPDPFQTILWRTFVNPMNLKWVEILTSEKT